MHLCKWGESSNIVWLLVWIIMFLFSQNNCRSLIIDIKLADNSQEKKNNVFPEGMICHENKNPCSTCKYFRTSNYLRPVNSARLKEQKKGLTCASPKRSFLFWEFWSATSKSSTRSVAQSHCSACGTLLHLDTMVITKFIYFWLSFPNGVFPE